MLIAGIALLALGTAGIFAAVGMEIATRDPFWKIWMKVFPWFCGLGMFLIGMSFLKT